LLLRLHVLLLRMMRVAVSPLNAGSRQQLCGLLHVLDEFLFLASLSKSLVPKDLAEVSTVACVVMLLFEVAQRLS